MNATATRFTLAALALIVTSLATAPCSAVVSTYANIPSIGGVNPTPGYPNAMAASSVTIAPGGYSIIKNIDAASPAIFGAVAGGTPLGTTSLLFYNAAPVTPPTAVINFTSTLASSYSTLGPTTENVAFNSTNPVQLYLEVPGIPGESATPGYSNIMQIHEFTLAGDFSVLRATDSASDDIALATAIGTHFPTANLLLYNSPPAGPPDAILSFSDLLISSYTPVGGQPALERVSFNYANLLPQVPEPTTAVLVGIAIAALVGGGRTRAVIDPRE